MQRTNPAGLFFALTISLSAQTNAPLSMKPPEPNVEGIYFVGPLVTAPKLVKVMTAGYPSGVRASDIAGFTVLSMVIGADGIPTGIEVLHTHGEAFDAAATQAVKQSKFAPGMMTLPSAPARPVPVRIDVRVPFHSNQAQAVPVIVIAERDLAPPAAAQANQKYTPPIPIHTVDADFMDPHAKSTYEAIAIVTVSVSTEGLPTDVRIRRGLTHSADEKAIAAVKQYRFLPATNKGKPVAASRELEVKFNMF
jgi:TonB family protein